MRWNDTNNSNNEEWYMQDSSGQRVLRRSQQGSPSNTTLTVYAFGLEEHQYSYSGSGSSDTNTANTYYYSLAGQLVGLSNGSSTNFLFTDALGSVVSSISNTANSASVKGNQVYGPYGNNAYSKGTIGTARGYTGQYNDAFTQLDYYGARYYDPFVGIFLSADKMLGNPEGMDPYAYVGENPESYIDPGGEMYTPPPDAQPQGTPPPPAVGTSSTIPWLLQSTQNANWQTDACTQFGQGEGCKVTALLHNSSQVPVVSNGRHLSLMSGCLFAISGFCISLPTPVSNDGGITYVDVHSVTPVELCTESIVCSDFEKRVQEMEAGGSVTDEGGGVLASDTGGGEAPDLGSNAGDVGGGEQGLPPEENGPVHVLLPENRYPEAASHIQNVAVARGINLDEMIWHWDPEEADVHRDEALAGWPTVPGKDRDEFPMAAMFEGGAGADIMYISPSDNRGAGSFLANQLRGYPSGQPFIIHIVNEWLF